jgi:hypothetical protein
VVAEFFAGIAGEGLAQGLGGAISNIPSTFVELYQMRRDGTFAQQQELLSRLRTREDDRHREWLDRHQLHLDEVRQAERREDHLTRLGEMRTSLSLALIRDHHRVALELMQQGEIERREHGPFKRDGDHARADVAQFIAENGGVPALLIAPFVDETKPNRRSTSR